MIRVTVEDLEAGTKEVAEIWNDYIVITAGNRYVDGFQQYPGKGTTIVTIKTDREAGEAPRD